MLDRLKATIASAGSALVGFTSQYTGTIAQYLVPTYLRNLLWIMQGKFLSLARDGYGKNAVVYACMRVLCSSVAEPPLDVFVVNADGTEDELRDANHELTKLLARPNELQTQYQMVEMIALHTAIAGRSLWWKERNNDGSIRALWPLRPDRCGPVYSGSDEDGERVISHWSYQLAGQMGYVPIPRADVVAFVFPDPAGDSGGLVEGIGPLQVLATEVSSDNEASQFVGALVRNYAGPGVILKTKTPVRDAEVAKRLKRNYIDQFGGEMRGAPAIVDGDTEVTVVSFNMKQLEFPDLRGVAESRIAAAFGVPAIMVGLKIGLENGIRATISEQREYFAETTLTNLWRRFEDQLTNDLAAEFGPYRVRFDRTKVRALAMQTKNEKEPIADAFKMGAALLDEYRIKVLDLDPLPDGKGQVFFVPNTVTIVRADEIDAPPQPPPSPFGGMFGQPPGRPELPPKTPAKELPEPSSASKARRQRAREAEDAAEEPAPAAKAVPGEWASDAPIDVRAAAVLATVDALAADATTALTDRLAKLGNTVAERTVAANKAWEPASQAGVADVDARDFYNFLRAHWALVLKRGAEDAGERVGVKLDFNVPNPNVDNVLDQVATRVVGIVETTREGIREKISEANEKGWTVRQLADALRSAYAFSAARAETIALTETAEAYNRGTILGYRESGMVHMVDVADGDGCAVCAGINGQVWTLDKAEANPIEHSRCRRVFLPRLDEQEQVEGEAA